MKRQDPLRTEGKTLTDPIPNPVHNSAESSQSLCTLLVIDNEFTKHYDRSNSLCTLLVIDNEFTKHNDRSNVDQKLLYLHPDDTHAQVLAQVSIVTDKFPAL
jgi:hypothetical protein